MSNAELLEHLAPIDTEPHASNLEIDRAVKDLALRIRSEIGTGNEEIMTLEAVELMLGALFDLYSGHAEQQGRLTPLRLGESVNATAVLMATSALLRGANLELFELGMWQSWSGMK